MSDQRDSYIKNPVIHLTWVVIVLLLCISALIIYLPDGNVVYNYLSFASAIASISLALVAIFYSMVSNRSFDAALGDVRSSAAKVAEETARLNLASQGFSHEAIEAIKLLPTQFSAMSNAIETKIDNISFNKPYEDGGNPQTSEQNVFESGGKPYGLVLSLYAMYFSEKKTKEINLDNMFKKSNKTPTKNYMNGILDTIKHFKVCGVQIDGIQGVYLVNDLGNLDLKPLASSVEDTSIDNEYFVEIRALIQNYFNTESKPNNDSQESPELD